MSTQVEHETDESLLLDKQVCFALYAASNLLTGLYRPLLSEIGLTFPQYLVMLVLWEESPQSVGSLGQQLYLDSGTLTPLLKRMEVTGLVTRQRDANDERRVLIELTEQGRLLRSSARKVVEQLTSGPFLPSSEAEALRNGARKLIHILTDEEHVEE